MHYPINHDETPIRLFESNFLEFFTHISPIVVIAIWLPVGLFLLISEIAAGSARGSSLWYIPVAVLIGLFVWTLTEYTLHRFVFHYRPRGPRQERIVYLFHGIHHHQPQCKTRLVMPPIVSVPLAFVFYGLFTLIVGRLLGGPQWVRPLFTGFIIGYLCYDLIHYATHHFKMRTPVARYLKRYHLKHHYKTPDMRFGVSSPLWDYVFGTRPAN